MGVTGGKSQGVYVVSEAEVASGAFRVQPGPAIKVSGLQSATRGILGGNAIPVYVVSDPSARGVEGGESLPVSNLTGIRAPEKGLAIPVYVVSDEGQFAAALDLTAPSDLAAVAISDTEIDLTWTDTAPDAEGYKIERSPGGTGTWVEIDDIAAPATGYSDTGLTPETEYDYRIRAYAGVTNGGYSNTATATTDAFVGAFDGITFAALYALVRFLSAYTGSLIRLRRDSDEAEEDFTYVSDSDPFLDTAAIATWLGGANPFIVTWKDSSGNARDATQATAANQPAYTASAINSLPGLVGGSDDVLTASLATTSTAYSMFGVVQLTEAGGGKWRVALQRQCGGQRLRVPPRQ